MPDARRILRDLTPPAIARAVAGRSSGLTTLVDGFANWDEAVARAGTYSEASILDRVRTATDAVIAGNAAFERDGVLFPSLEYRWPVVAALMWQAARDHGRLRVLDFGGSLGSTFRQYQSLLGTLDVRWGVVEQPAFVEAGAPYTSQILTFHDSIEACVDTIQPNVVLLSSVLQYLPDPHRVLRRLGTLDAGTLVIDRTPMVDGTDDQAIVQVVPATIYEASYPAWLLTRDRLMADLPGWRLVDEFPGIEPAMATSSGRDVVWHGMTFSRP